MHHFIFPSKDTYITNRTDWDTKNFGVDEILQIGTTNTTLSTISDTRNYVYVDQAFNNSHVESFTGTFTGSVLPGTASFTGSLVSVTACLTGTGSGTDVRNERNRVNIVSQYVDRALLQFDLTEISAAMARGEITSPSFFLNLKVCNEYQLPVNYSIYALALSQSWNMGNGYFSDGGSDEGVSWRYRDNNDGTPWYTSSLTGPRTALDFISNPSLLTASFGYGGGTWQTGSYCSQSFGYQSSDIDMNVTPIVLAWLGGNIPNEGILLIQSDELIATGSGFTLKFFSRDTNTIYSPYLDVAWDDSVFSTGSIFTASSQTVTISSGISASVASGSSISAAGGVNGTFSGSAVIVERAHYLTASNTIFLPSLLVQNFTGSLVGSFFVTAQTAYGTISGSNLIFSASYFTGSIDGVYTEKSGSISGSLISGSVGGTIESFTPFGLFTGQLTSSAVYLNGTASGVYLDPNYNYFTGFLACVGIGGNISGSPVFGTVHGLLVITSSIVVLPEDIVTTVATSPNMWPFVSGYNLVNPTSPYNPLINSFYVWVGPDSWWAGTLPILPSFAVTSSCGVDYNSRVMAGVFDGGMFSGSSFTAYYYNHGILLANLTGSWNVQSLYSFGVSIPLPSGIDPYAYAYVNSPYVYGTALGLYAVSGSTSASFDGQFIDGPLVGGSLFLQLTGSVYTSSYTYQSGNMTSSYLVPLDVTKPFSINLQNLQPQYKAGDIVKIDVFGRKKFPLKYFGTTTQQTQYLVPEYLPVSSSFALKDNQTDEIVINFDNYTRISCEYPSGNYFVVDTTGLPQERYYNVLIRVQSGSVIYTIDTGKTFKITR